MITRTGLIICMITLSFHISKAQQRINLGIHADPVIGWFGTDVDNVKNEGTKAGFHFGLTINRYFSQNYSFSTGISLLNAGGRLVNKDTIEMDLNNTVYKVNPDIPVTYRMQYLTIPVGIKLQTNQIGYITFFTDLGVDPKFVIQGKADIPALDISGVKATNELKMFNLSYHFTAGVEYSFGGNTAAVLGLNFDNNFLDITKDNGSQPEDIVSHKILSFRIGINF